MNIVMGVLLASIYVVFAMMILSNIEVDGFIGNALWNEAKATASVNHCEDLAFLEPPPITLFPFTRYFAVFIILLPLSTLGFLAYTCLLNVRRKKAS